jgi:hypothetical protein
MAGFSNYLSQGVLGGATAKTAFPTVTAAYIALFTAVGSDAGTGFTEVSGGSYARVTTSAASWNSPGGTSPSTESNASSLTFPAATASWGTIIAVGLYDALTSGNLLAWDYLGNFNWSPVTITAASPGVVTFPANGFSAADSIIFTTEFGGAAPTVSAGSLSGTLTVISPTTDTFTMQNGATAINTSTSGSGMIRKITPLVVNTGGIPTFGAGSLVLYSS